MHFTCSQCQPFCLQPPPSNSDLFSTTGLGCWPFAGKASLLMWRRTRVFLNVMPGGATVLCSSSTGISLYHHSSCYAVIKTAAKCSQKRPDKMRSCQTNVREMLLEKTYTFIEGIISTWIREWCHKGQWYNLFPYHTLEEHTRSTRHSHEHTHTHTRKQTRTQLDGVLTANLFLCTYTGRTGG